MLAKKPTESCRSIQKRCSIRRRTHVYRVYTCYKYPVILRDAAATLSSKGAGDLLHAETSSEDSSEVVVVSPSGSITTLIEANSLLLEAKECFLGCEIQTIITEIARKKIDALVQMICHCMAYLKKQQIPDANELHHHWASVAFTENLRPLCQRAIIPR